MASAATSAAANATAAAAAHSRGMGENYESADGMGMIDDDLGSFAAAAAGAAELAAAAANDAYGAASRELTGAWLTRASGPAEDFPSLQVCGRCLGTRTKFLRWKRDLPRHIVFQH